MPNVATSGSSSSWRTTAMAACTPAVSVAAVSVRSSTESRSIVAAISASCRERLRLLARVHEGERGLVGHRPEGGGARHRERAWRRSSRPRRTT